MLNMTLKNVFFYLTLTDTDSCSMFFVFICCLDCDVKDSEFGKIMFEILKNSKISKQLDRSNNVWKQSGIYDENTKNVMGLFDIENIGNPNICTIAVDPKEYLKNLTIDKLIKNIKALEETLQE